MQRVNRFRSLIGVTVLGASILLGLPVLAQEPDTSQTTQPDNTRMNKRDRSQDEPTADQQRSNRSDRDITQQIRRSLMDDKTLSTYAHNVKIITQNGMVTLKGPVMSEDEKQAIEQKAKVIAGSSNVTSELSIKADKGK
jgi:osmotically-inducible protein OsmY